MDEHVFGQVIDDIALATDEPRQYLNLWAWGEPLLHPNLSEMITYAKQCGLVVRVSSNLNTHCADIGDRIVDSGLDVLIVGLDGMSSSSHDAYRMGGDTETVIKNLGSVLRARRERNRDLPILVVTSLITKRLLPELNSLTSFCNDSGVDAHILKLPNLWRSKKDADEVTRLFEEFVVDRPAYSRYARGGPSSQDIACHQRCPFLNKRGVVLWNGDVTTCCFDHDGMHTFGNTQDRGLRNVLYGEKGGSAWSRMRSFDYDMCRFCDSGGERREIRVFTDRDIAEEMLAFL